MTSTDRKEPIMISRSLMSGVAAMILFNIVSPSMAGSTAQGISFASDQSYPESMTWSARQDTFMVGSVRHGLVAKVDKTGKYTVFVHDARLVSTAGLLVDDKRNTLWVTNSDPGGGDRTGAASKGKLAAVATYDATTGQPRAYYDLGSLSEGTHFANDIALDADGNAYVTDSFAPIVYRIDTAGKATIFAQDPRFTNGDGFKLNGIAWQKDGYLLVGKYNTGELFRVSIADPRKIDPVKLPETLTGADGIQLIDDQHLIVVQNLGADRTVELVSADGWASATIVRQERSIMSMPTAAAILGDDVYVLNSRLDTLFDPAADKVGDYLLQKL
ncbi:gluconolaconase [Mesorhizobium sp. M7A.F.Ca.MR.228.00.0.0]|nr:gluconolaconase [Mesorhizobium sp. M7A.F.Ca.MR.228.00.0.0]